MIRIKLLKVRKYFAKLSAVIFFIIVISTFIGTLYLHKTRNDVLKEK